MFPQKLKQLTLSNFGCVVFLRWYYHAAVPVNNWRIQQMKLSAFVGVYLLLLWVNLRPTISLSLMKVIKTQKFLVIRWLCLSTSGQFSSLVLISSIVKVSLVLDIKIHRYTCYITPITQLIPLAEQQNTHKKKTSEHLILYNTPLTKKTPQAQYGFSVTLLYIGFPSIGISCCSYPQKKWWWLFFFIVIVIVILVNPLLSKLKHHRYKLFFWCELEHCQLRCGLEHSKLRRWLEHSEL